MTGILAIWLTLGLACLIYFKPDEKKAELKNQVSYRSVFSNKTFLLYLIPWLMFSLINDLASESSRKVSVRFPDLFLKTI